MKTISTLRRHFCIIMLLIGTFAAKAQTDCNIAWYDNGGPNGQYGSNIQSEETFCPENPNDKVTVTFLAFEVRYNDDQLYVYDGPDINSPLIASNTPSASVCALAGGYSGSLQIPGPFTSTHPSGCLTFAFCSNGSGQRAGWEALVTCAPEANCIPPAIAYTQESFCADSTFTVTGIVTSASPTPGASEIVVSAWFNGSYITGLGGTFPNIAGSIIEIGPLPLDEDIIIVTDVVGFSCSSSMIVSDDLEACTTYSDLICGEAIETTYCYTNQATDFIYVSENMEPVLFYFNSGLISVQGGEIADGIAIYDGIDDSAPLLYQGDNGGNLAGISVVANSGSLLLSTIPNSFGSTSCASGSINTSPWNWTVGCGNISIPGCTDPAALNYAPAATENDGSCNYPVANDEPCGAYILECNGPTLTGNYDSASLSYNDGCDGNGTGDVWFKFTADGSTDYSVASSGNSSTRVIQLFIATGNVNCNNPSLEPITDCSGSFSNFAGVFEAGDYYFVVRQKYSNSFNGYSVSLTCADDTPPNNDPCGAYPLTANNGSVNGSFLGATVTTVPGCDFYDDVNADIWFSFEADGEQTYYVTAAVGSGVVRSLYTADECSGELIEVNPCTSLRYPIFGKYPAGTYYYRLGRLNTQISATATLISALPPANDDPCGAIEITPSETCMFTFVSNLGASDSPVLSPGCANYEGSDIWYVIHIDEPSSITVRTAPWAESFVSTTGLALYLGDCDGSLSLLECVSENVYESSSALINASGLMPGQSLYIRTWDYAGNEFGLWRICAKTEPIDCAELGTNIGSPCDDGDPSTDMDVVQEDCTCSGMISNPACSDALFIAATPGFGPSQITVSTAGLDASGATQCINSDNPQTDRWFAFTSVTTNMYILGWGQGDFDAALEVYDACGGNLLLCKNNTGAGQREIGKIPNTIVGDTYYFRVYHAGDVAPATQSVKVAVAHIPFTQLRPEDCDVYTYLPGDIIVADFSINPSAITGWYFEFTELEAPFNAYEILSPNGGNPEFNLSWFTQAELGRTYSVRTRAKIYTGTNWGDYGAACDIGSQLPSGMAQLSESPAFGSNDQRNADIAENGWAIVPASFNSNLSNVVVKLYPNPTGGDEVMLTLSNLNNEQQAIIVEVYDMFGKKVHSQNIANNGSEMNAALRFQKSLASGVYTVNVIVNDQPAGAQKLVVQ